MISERANFTISYDEIDKSFVDSLDVKKIESRVREFFGLSGPIKAYVNLLYSEQEWVASTRQIHERWKSGFMSRPNTIYVLSPSVIDKLTFHKPAEVPATIAHEYSHMAYFNLKFPNSRLVNEGIATYIKYNFDYDVPKKPNIYLDTEKIFDSKENPYLRGLNLVDSIVRNHGREKLLDFLARSRGAHKERDLELIIRKEFFNGKREK